MLYNDRKSINMYTVAVSRNHIQPVQFLVTRWSVFYLPINTAVVSVVNGMDFPKTCYNVILHIGSKSS